MATCGYVCPQCEGRGLDQDGQPCDWCDTPTPSVKDSEKEVEEWITAVHEGPCCSDPVEDKEQVTTK